MSEQKQTIVKSIEEIKEIVDLFYQQKEKEALDKLTLELGNMMNAMDQLFAYKAEHEDFEMNEEKITNTLKDAMNALHDGDMVLLADILQYDYLEYMEELTEEME